MRIGHGYDVHRYGDGDYIILGGVKIPHERGIIAHSDGDVLLHALCDAILGAAAMGDIGKHFPDDDQAYAGIDSRKLLRHVIKLISEKNYRVGNVDITVIAQSPKISAFTVPMVENIASDLGIQREYVNVKATTTEKLGFIGEKKGIAAEAVVLLFSGAIIE